MAVCLPAISIKKLLRVKRFQIVDVIFAFSIAVHLLVELDRLFSHTVNHDDGRDLKEGAPPLNVERCRPPRTTEGISSNILGFLDGSQFSRLNGRPQEEDV